MNKKLLAFVGSSSLVLGMLSFAILAKGVETKETKALSEDLHIDLHDFWADCGGDASHESVNITSSNGQFFDDEENESELFTFTVEKHTHTPTIRNYHLAGTTYYLGIPYCEPENFESPGPTFLKINNAGDHLIQSISMNVRHDDYATAPFIIPGSTIDAEKITALVWDNGESTYVFDEPVSELYVICNEKTANASNSQIQGLSIVAVKGEALTFDTQGGSVVNKQYLVSGEHPTKPADPTKPTVGTTSYEFAGWFDAAEGGNEIDFDEFTITGPTTIYAHWNEATASNVTITFNSNGGTDVDPLVVPAGSIATAPTAPTRSSSVPSKYYFSFQYWCSDEALTHEFDWANTAIETDITLFAKWRYGCVDHTPSGRVHYTVNNGASTWASTDHFANDTFYQDVTLLSTETFNTAGDKEPISVHITANDSHHGFQVHNVYSPLVHTTTIEVKPVDPTKIITYFRLDLGNWGESTVDINLYNGEILVDSAKAPNPTENVHYVAASFDVNEAVGAVKVTTGSFRMVLKDIYIKFDDNPAYEAALNYATAFNDANVCGLTDDAGLDETAWQAQKEDYLALDEIVRNFLRDSDITEGEIGECLERYDRVVTLHGVDYDFMGRVAAGKLVLTGINGYQPNSVDKLAAILTISLLAVASLTAMGCVIVYKKTKQR